MNTEEHDSKAEHDLRIVATPADGWCDPATGACLIDSSVAEIIDGALHENAPEHGT